MIWFFFVRLLSYDLFDLYANLFAKITLKIKKNQGFRTILLFLVIVFDIFLAVYSSFVRFICIKIGWMF